MPDFDQQNHPEIKEGEVWIANVSREFFETLSWQTKRLGRKAYDSEGYELPGRHPIFIQLAEKKAGR